MKKILTGVLIAATLAFSSATIAEDGHNAEKMPVEANVISQFSPEIQELLTKEMIRLQNSMMQMMPAIAAGEWDMVVTLADGMAKSHIMKQNLTREQMESLHKGLPLAFKVLDNQFHDFASMLSHVTRERHIELTTFYYYKLTETCVACHSQFAQKRFPGLGQPSNTHRPEGEGSADHHDEHQQHH
ncbi:MAG: hypothetical protein L3J28_11745 [Candidatus Polarisedimenticolaceae bacterium]|nr:hypothetical protein [Candidatus Polarisedimenticolaceae bacterium]